MCNIYQNFKMILFACPTCICNSQTFIEFKLKANLIQTYFKQF